MFEGIKGKLGFIGNHDDGEYDDPYYEEVMQPAYDEYDDFDDYEVDPDYGEYGYGAPTPSIRRSSSVSYSSDAGPRLVSIDDVKSRTQVPDSLNRNPLPERRSSTSSSSQGTSSYDRSRSSSSPASRSSYARGNRTVERASDYLLSTETSDNPTMQHNARGTGLDALLPSTSSAVSSSSLGSPSATSLSAPGGSSRAYDPYDTFSGSGAVSHKPTRSLKILKPVSYAEVERVAKIIKSGDVVVLSLRNTPDHLAKRILDFSFGVSSALDASVDCIADKVFVIIRGDTLSDEERFELRGQGVL